MVRRWSRRSLEPCRGRHGIGRRRSTQRGRTGLSVVGGTYSDPTGSWHQYYLGDEIEQGQARCQRHRLRRHRRMAPPPDPPRLGVPGHHVAGGPAGHRLRTGPPDTARRDPVGPPHRRHALVVRPAHRVVVDCSQPALCAWPLPRPPASTDPTGSCHLLSWPHAIRYEPDAFAPKHRWGHGLVLPGPLRRDHRRARCDTAGPPDATRS